MNDLGFYPMTHGDDDKKERPMNITQDWDKENYVKTLDAAYEEYREACYGNTPMPIEQIRETRQAFLSGIHWLTTREDYDPDEIERALRKILARNNQLINLPTKKEN